MASNSLNVGTSSEVVPAVREHAESPEANFDPEFGREEFTYIYVANIPSGFRSADLRTFFSQFVERGLFKCFHFRHRPDCSPGSCKAVDKDRNTLGKEIRRFGTDSVSPKKGLGTYCCVVKLASKSTEQFLEVYQNKEWRKDGGYLAQRVSISVLHPESTRGLLPASEYKSKRDLAGENNSFDPWSLDFRELDALIELNPPSAVMPQGNVGTPTKYFLSLISQCKMPSGVIKKLGIQFPKRCSRNMYGSVPFNYEPDAGGMVDFAIGKNSRKFPEERHTQNRVVSSSCRSPLCARTGCAGINCEQEGGADAKGDSDDEAEDWERYEALHDDVTCQDRNKERLFEEDIELKWEKGGSGLVFYTDAYYWNEMKGKDFDEDTVDDWDVDYSIYYDEGAGDKPARDQLRMRIEQRRRQGLDDGTDVTWKRRRRPQIVTSQPGCSKAATRAGCNEVAAFEKYSKAYGSRILSRHGWKPGSGVGSWTEGIKEPIEADYRKPDDKKGVGYYGRKLDRCVGRKRVAEKDVYIGSVYDLVVDGEQQNSIRYFGPDVVKYRDRPVVFEKATGKSDGHID